LYSPDLTSSDSSLRTEFGRRREPPEFLELPDTGRLLTL